MLTCELWKMSKFLSKRCNLFVSELLRFCCRCFAVSRFGFLGVLGSVGMQQPISKVEIQKFPRFQNLPKQAIHVIQNLEQCEAIRAELEQVSIFGFDSESKPTFQVGEVSTGPHLIQLASVEQAYLFQMSPPIWSFLAPFLANPDQLKVGFGLKNDAHLFRKKGFELKGVVELSKCFASFGLTNPVGIKNAIALLFQLNFPKSKKVSTSNWARKILTPEQVDYAAADAYAALLVFEELRRLEQLPKDISKELEKTTKPCRHEKL